MSYLPNRDENEQTIRLLADRYPKCFFAIPQQRKPLKKTILADLQADGVPVAYELLGPAVAWYQTHIAYQYALQAGAGRIDLHGKEVSRVTTQEQYAAEIKIKDIKQKLTERNSVKTLQALHVNGRIPDDQLKKLDAPPLAPREIPTKAKTAPELERVYRALATASSLMTGESDALRSAMAAAALGVVINEAQRAINGMTAEH